MPLLAALGSLIGGALGGLGSGAGAIASGLGTGIGGLLGGLGGGLSNAAGGLIGGLLQNGAGTGATPGGLSIPALLSGGAGGGGSALGIMPGEFDILNKSLGIPAGGSPGSATTALASNALGGLGGEDKPQPINVPSFAPQPGGNTNVGQTGSPKGGKGSAPFAAGDPLLLADNLPFSPEALKRAEILLGLSQGPR